MNSGFEDEIRRALGRVEPPDGFADRVMARLPNDGARHRYWFGAVAAGIALLFTFGGIQQNRREHRMEAEKTQQQVVFALSLAAEKLDHVNARLQRSAPELTIDRGERGQL